MSLMATFTFHYSAEIDAETEARIVPLIDRPLVRNDDGKINMWDEYQADLSRLLPVLGSGIQIEVKGLGRPQPLAEIADSLGRIERALGTPGDAGTYVNHRVDVHVPGNALLAIDEVELISDCCTDYLSERLGQGWRIVAVCPQPDQRRPDYILGRRQPRDD